MGKGSSRVSQAGRRERLAQEAARLMIEHGIADFRLAKRKAAARLALSGSGDLPTNAQIEACLVERQRIFEPQVHDNRVQILRRLALDAMSELADFEPRLVGSVLAGTATINSSIELHLFAASAELVAACLQRSGRVFSICQRRYRFSGARHDTVPGFRLFLDGARVYLIVFPEKGVREAPLSPVDQRPMARAGRSRVMTLLED